MLRIYARKDVERELLEVLAEFKCRVYTTYPLKGVTRKVRGSVLYKVHNFPIAR